MKDKWCYQLGQGFFTRDEFNSRMHELTKLTMALQRGEIAKEEFNRRASVLEKLRIADKVAEVRILGLELCPWEYLSEKQLREFLVDPHNNENAPDRKIVIDYLKNNFVKPSFLDVGCGPGHMYLALKQSGVDFDYCGIDKTEKMVEFARKRFPDAFNLGDIHDLPPIDLSWRVVYCRHVLVHLPGYKEALSELARVCSDCLIICLLKPLSDKDIVHVEGNPLNQTKPGNFSEHYLNTYAREPFMEQLKNLGFNVVIDKMVEVGGYFKNYELIIARRK